MESIRDAIRIRRHTFNVAAGIGKLKASPETPPASTPADGIGKLKASPETPPASPGCKPITLEEFARRRFAELVTAGSLSTAQRAMHPMHYAYAIGAFTTRGAPPIG